MNIELCNLLYPNQIWVWLNRKVYHTSIMHFVARRRLFVHVPFSVDYHRQRNITMHISKAIMRHALGLVARKMRILDWEGRYARHSVGCSHKGNKKVDQPDLTHYRSFIIGCSIIGTCKGCISYTLSCKDTSLELLFCCAKTFCSYRCYRSLSLYCAVCLYHNSKTLKYHKAQHVIPSLYHITTTPVTGILTVFITSPAHLTLLYFPVLWTCHLLTNSR